MVLTKLMRSTPREHRAGDWLLHTDDRGKRWLVNWSKDEWHELAADAHGNYEAGSQRSRVTATRVLGGAVLGAGVGAIVGGLARKDISVLYIAVQGKDEVVSFELPVKEESHVRTLLAAVNAPAESTSPLAGSQGTGTWRLPPAPAPRPVTPPRPAPSQDARRQLRWTED